jgi:hypothetical protein
MRTLLIALAFSALCLTARADLDVARIVGESLPLTVKHDGTLPCTYQWLKDGLPIAGATAKDFVLTVTAASAGAYSVIVSNLAGRVTSDAARLTVIVPPSKATVAVPAPAGGTASGL